MLNSRKSMVYLLIFSFMIGVLISSYSPTFLFLNPEISGSKDSSQPSSSPVSAQLGDYDPYGVYISAQNYYQGNVNETNTEQRELRFTFHKSFGGTSDLYRIFIDSVLNVEIYYPSDDIYYYLPDFMFQNASVYNVTCAFHHSELDKWFFATTIVNITENYPRFSRYYWNFCHNQWNSIYLDWTLFLPDYGYFNYSLYIDNIPYTMNYNVYYSYHGYPISIYVSGDPFNIPNVARQLKFIVSDANGKTTINQFKIIVASQNYPWINQISSIPQQIRLWETQDVKLSVLAHDNDGDLDKIYIFLNDFVRPYMILENAESDRTYEVPISQYYLDKLINIDFLYELRFSAVAVDKSRKASPESNPAYFSYQKTGFWQFGNSTVDQAVNKGKFISVLESSYEFSNGINSSPPSFKLNIVASVKSAVNIKVNFLNAQTWMNNLQNRWDYKRGDYNDGQTFATWEYRYTQYSQDKTAYLAAGCVFWILVSNYSAVEWPILVKITYPSEINPDPILNEPSLQFLERLDYGYYAEWYAYTNENLTSTNRDERILQIDTNAVEVNIYNEGLFGFGRDQALYENKRNNDGFYIAGYDLGLYLVILGVISAFLLARESKRFHSSY